MANFVCRVLTSDPCVLCRSDMSLSHQYLEETCFAGKCTSCPDCSLTVGGPPVTCFCVCVSHSVISNEPLCFSKAHHKDRWQSWPVQRVAAQALCQHYRNCGPRQHTAGESRPLILPLQVTLICIQGWSWPSCSYFSAIQYPLKSHVAYVQSLGASMWTCWEQIVFIRDKTESVFLLSGPVEGVHALCHHCCTTSVWMENLPNLHIFKACLNMLCKISLSSLLNHIQW